MLQHALQARRIHEADASASFHGREGHSHPADLFRIFRVLVLRDEFGDPLHRNVLCAPVKKPDLCLLTRSILNLGQDGGHRDHAHRQQLLAEKVIEKTALAGLEAPEDRDVERLLLGEAPTTLQEVIQGRHLMAATQLCDRVQRALDRLCYLCFAFRIHHRPQNKKPLPASPVGVIAPLQAGTRELHRYCLVPICHVFRFTSSGFCPILPGWVLGHPREGLPRPSSISNSMEPSQASGR